MTITSPSTITLGDLCTEALHECGAVGVGQTPLAEDLTGAWARLQFMLQEWERKRWLVFALTTLSVTSTGATSYTVGPSGSLNTGATSVRPDRIESAFLRQITQSAPNQIDYPLTQLQSREDYNRIALKSLVSFPSAFFYDTAWPLGVIYPWPVPQATIYALHVTVKVQLPFAFATRATTFSLPYEYYSAMMYNLALRLRPKYGLSSFQGDELPGLAKNSLNVLRGANAQIARLGMPVDLGRNGIYNIFSDRTY